MNVWPKYRQFKYFRPCFPFPDAPAALLEPHNPQAADRRMIAASGSKVATSVPWPLGEASVISQESWDACVICHHRVAKYLVPSDIGLLAMVK